MTNNELDVFIKQNEESKALTIDKIYKQWDVILANIDKADIAINLQDEIFKLIKNGVVQFDSHIRDLTNRTLRYCCGKYPQTTNAVRIITESISDFNCDVFFGDYAHLVDSEIMHFEEDILIIDPGILFTNFSQQFTDLTSFGVRGINHAILQYGWECYVYDLSTQQALGKFNDVSHNISVLPLSDAKKLRPDIDRWDNFGCVISNFAGDIQIKVENNTDGLECYVYGEGINTETNKPFMFTSCQTN